MSFLLYKWNQREDNTGGLHLGDPSSHQTPEAAQWRLTRAAGGVGTAAGQSFCKGDGGLGESGGTSHAAEGAPVVRRSHDEHTMDILPQLEDEGEV